MVRLPHLVSQLLRLAGLAFMCTLAAVVIYPIFFAFNAALKDPTLFKSSQLSLAFPPDFGALTQVWTLIDVPHSALNSLIISIGAPIGSAIGALTSDSWGRKPTIVGASLLTILVGSFYPFIKDPLLLSMIGFILMIPIYVLVTVCFAVYIPELFPTEVRLRASGICNTFGRGATIVTPFFVVALFRHYGVGGVISMLVGLLIIEIILVLIFGIEPKNRRLEDINL